MLQAKKIARPEKYNCEQRRTNQAGTITVFSNQTIKQNVSKKYDTTIKQLKQWHWQTKYLKSNPNPSTCTPILRKYKTLYGCITIKVSIKMIRIRLCSKNFFGSSSSLFSVESMSIHVVPRNYMKRLSYNLPDMKY